MGLRLHLYIKITVPTKGNELGSISINSLHSAHVQLVQRRVHVQLYLRTVTAPRNTLPLHPQPYLSH